MAISKTVAAKFDESVTEFKRWSQSPPGGKVATTEISGLICGGADNSVNQRHAVFMPGQSAALIER